MSERFVFNYGIREKGHNPPLPVPDRPQPARQAASVRSREKTDWAFVGLMVFTALLFFRPQDSIPALRVLQLTELSALGALGALVAGRLGRGLPATRLTPELIGVVALGGVILATAPFSVWMGGAVGTFTDLFMKVMLIFILMVNTLSTPKRIEQFTWLLVLASGYLGGRAVIDYARGLNLIENGRVQGAVGGMFQNPNDLALNMVAVLPFAVMLGLRPMPILRRVTALACAGLILGAIVVSHSRSGALGFVAMTLVLLFQITRRRPGLGVAAVLVAVLAAPLAPSSYWNRLSSITDESRDETGSREARRTLLRESFAAFVENPLTGVGAGMLKVYKPEQRQEAWREAHNVLLQVGAELGIVGLMVFLFLFFSAARGPMQTRRLLNGLGRPPNRRKRRVGAAHTGDAAPRIDDVLTREEQDILEAHCPAISASLVGWFVCALFASVAFHWTFYYLLALAVTPRDVVLARINPPQARRRAAAFAPAAAESAV